MKRTTTRKPLARGTAVTELAVCLPLLVLLTVAAIEACSMIYLKQSVTVAAYEGARVALIPGAKRSNVEAQCNQILSDRGVTGAVVTVSPNPRSAAPGTFVAVHVVVPCSDNSPIIGGFFVNRSITGHVEMMKEL